MALLRWECYNGRRAFASLQVAPEFPVEEPLFQPAGLNICIFPHLREFLVIDARTAVPGGPQSYLLSTDEVLDTEFYRDLEESVGAVVRSTPQNFAELGNLPQKVDETMREQALRAILRRINIAISDEELPEVSVFLCAGAALSIPVSQMDQAVQTMLGTQADARTLTDSLEHLHRLIDEERSHARAEDAELARQAVNGEADHYFTLWSRDYSEPPAAG